MASPLLPQEVAHIAELARLELSAAEQETFTRQLTDILAYANTVQQVDTTGIDLDVATVVAVDASDAPARFRADTAVPGVSRDEVIAQAPDGVRESGLFRVPKVI